METVRIDEVTNLIQPAAVMRRLTDALGTANLAINYYELEPGDSFAYAYHKHDDQEEVFYIQSGTATFETADGPVAVSAGELIRFEPGEFQRGWNRGEDVVRALALGAPRETTEQVRLRECPTCGEATDNRLELVGDKEAVIAVCNACETETGRWYEGSMPGTVP